MKKKILLLGLVFLVLTSVILFNLVSWIGGNFHHNEPYQALSQKARDLVERAAKPFQGQTVIDLHTHLVGIGTSGKGTYIHPGMLSIMSPTRYFKFLVYKNAAGIINQKNADSEYLQRLNFLIKQLPYKAKFALMAFDKHYKKDGSVDENHTEFYVENEYMYSVYQQNPQHFIPVISVHPYRKDAVEQLNFWSSKGVRFIKWLPNAMGIDPANQAIKDYYQQVKKNDMVIITHTGHEAAVEAESYQALGNPLLFRFPLDLGVKIVMAHCATSGSYEDLDNPGTEQKSAFDLFLRLMNESRYNGQLYGELSAVTQFNRFPGHLARLIEKKELHSRLINGSDYPLPAINFIVHLRPMVKAGLLSDQEAILLKEIYQNNPLLFDFVLKRTVRHPVKGNYFDASSFLYSIL